MPCNLRKLILHELVENLYYEANELFQKLKLDRPLSEQKTTTTVSPKVEFPQALAFASLKNFKIPKVIFFSKKKECLYHAKLAFVKM